jgi:hypothetical protein
MPQIIPAIDHCHRLGQENVEWSSARCSDFCQNENASYIAVNMFDVNFGVYQFSGVVKWLLISRLIFVLMKYGLIIFNFTPHDV